MNNIISILDAFAGPSPSTWLLNLIDTGTNLTIVRTETEFEREDMLTRVKQESKHANTSWLSLAWENLSATAHYRQRDQPPDMARKMSGLSPGGFIHYARDLSPDLVIVESVNGVPQSLLPNTQIAGKAKFWMDYASKLRELTMDGQRNVLLFQRGDQYRSLNFVADLILKCSWRKPGRTWNVEVVKNKRGPTGQKMARPA